MGRLIVLDFDGTMTDAELEGAPFRQGYLEDVAVLAGLSFDEALAMAERFEAEVAANPQATGWVYNGHIVAPSTVDPYLRIMPVARRIFDACGAFRDERDRTRLLDGVLYKYNYHKTNIAFRPGALEALRSLRGSHAYVVTNSHTDAVRNKIRTLGGESGELDWLIERVYGRASKYVVEEDFESVPASLHIDGLSRPVLLRRKRYYDVLKGLLDGAGLGWADLLVVGDVFELDLALPLALGARVGLVVNEFTPSYEREFVASHPRAHLVTELSQIPGLLAEG